MILLIVYFIVMMICTMLFTKKSDSIEDLLVGKRNVGPFKSALSIAATWIWAPALLVSSEKAYQWGWVGLFWFLVPNILCLIFFSGFADKIRKSMPSGYSLAGYMEKEYDAKVKKIYLAVLTIITVMSTVVQLLAGGLLISTITGGSFLTITIVLSLITFCYSQFSGIEASIVTDAIQMITMIIISIIIVYSAFNRGFNIGDIKSGIYGIDGNYKSLVSSEGRSVFLAFGLSSAIGLISGPFGDQAFWQRAFATKSGSIKKSFILGAIMFAIVPLAMGAIGFLASGIKMPTNNIGMVNVEFIRNYLPDYIIYLFEFVMISGLLSTVDSNLCSITSLANEIKSTYNLRQAKITMAILLVLGVIGANIPNITVTKLFMIYGATRSSTLLITILTLKDYKLDSKGVSVGIATSLVVGLPIFIYGTINGVSTLTVLGSLISVLASGVVAIIYTKWRNKYGNQESRN